MTVADAALALGITPRRVRALIRAGHLHATRHGSIWWITPHALEAVRDRHPGRPPKKKQEEPHATI